MRTWIGATALAAFVAVTGTGTIDVASAAKIITIPQKVRSANAADLNAQRITHRAYRNDRYGERRQYDGDGWTYYYGRPYLYIPAPFPLGFDFGFGW